VTLLNDLLRCVCLAAAFRLKIALRKYNTIIQYNTIQYYFIKKAVRTQL